MLEEHKQIFKRIVKAYYDDSMDETVNELLSSSDIDKSKLAKIISSMCGVSVDYSENYIENLKKAISIYKLEQKHKIVERTADCSMNCSPEEEDTNCQKTCPFDAILVDRERHTTYIDSNSCSDCGICVDSCDEGNIIDKTEFIPFAHLLREKVPVIAAVAPAIIGQFGPDVTMDQLRSAFKKIGFKDMFEVAFFADMLTLKEAFEFDEHVHKKDDLMITSCCCPMWVGMLRRVYNDLVKYVSPSVSPMIAAGRVLKKLNADCKVVFIGPCIAKKAEAREKDLIGDIDYVLTFEELKTIFEALEVNPSELEEDHTIEYASKGGRIYGRTGGVSVAVSDAIRELFPRKYELLKAVQANGVKECKELLNKAMEGNIDANFIEGMGCIGGCVGGPKAIIPREEGRDRINEYGQRSDIEVAVHSDTMKEILKRIGIDSIDDFKHSKELEIFERNF
jgi:iron only hydrogenase large subunit-like protein